jgi:hypothetical protein
MRGWAATVAFLIASTAAADVPGAEVPPLADDESAPADPPNYFEARELGAATLATFATCQSTVAWAYPNAAEDTLAAYCGCFADSARWNVRAGHAASPTDAQVSKCIEATRAQAPSPFARQFAIPTAWIADTFHACMDAAVGEVSTGHRGFVCGCATNAGIAHRLQANKLDDDLARCTAAVRYRQTTGQNPTVRQFGGIRVTRSPAGPAGSDASARPDLPPPRTFIPYPGNGGGPTLCSDGTYSHSTGRGTCSGHGGISGGRHRRR